PIHIDDVAACIVSAARRDWSGPNVMAIAGPTSLRLRDVAEAYASALRRTRLVLPIPIAPGIAILELAERAGLKLKLTSGMLRRLREDVMYPTAAMKTELGV